MSAIAGGARPAAPGTSSSASKLRYRAFSYDGGYAQYMVAPVDALARVPEDLSDVDAAPLLCAGITTFNALRNSGARAGDLVAIHGIGGLGHLGVQYAAKMGFRTVAIARGRDKGPGAAARRSPLHRQHRGDLAEALKAMGGAKGILATVTSGDAMSAVVPGLGRNGKLLIVGVAMEPVQVPTVPMIMNRASVQGWPSGTAQDSTETLAFSAMTKVRPMIE